MKFNFVVRVFDFILEIKVSENTDKKIVKEVNKQIDKSLRGTHTKIERIKLVRSIAGDKIVGLSAQKEFVEKYWIG